jgi:hypothetical protein
MCVANPFTSIALGLRVGLAFFPPDDFAQKVIFFAVYI